MNLFADVIVVYRYRPHPNIRIRRGVAPDKFRPDRVELTNRVRVSHARFETPEYIQLSRSTQLTRSARGQSAERQPYHGIAWKLRPVGHDADNSRLNAIDAQRRANQRCAT